MGKRRDSRSEADGRVNITDLSRPHRLEYKYLRVKTKGDVSTNDTIPGTGHTQNSQMDTAHITRGRSGRG